MSSFVKHETFGERSRGSENAHESTVRVARPPFQRFFTSCDETSVLSIDTLQKVEVLGVAICRFDVVEIVIFTSSTSFWFWSGTVIRWLWRNHCRRGTRWLRLP